MGAGGKVRASCGLGRLGFVFSLILFYRVSKLQRGKGLLRLVRINLI